MLNDDDLFADSTMSFGEHLEVLRGHLIRALIGVILGSVVGLAFGGQIIGEIKRPLVQTLQKYAYIEAATAVGEIPEETIGQWVRRQLGLTALDDAPVPEAARDDSVAQLFPEKPGVIEAEVSLYELMQALHEAQPDSFPKPAEAMREQLVPITMASGEFAQFQASAINSNKPVTLNVQEGFLTYLKVSFVAGFVIASPWVFYQAWLFVAAGLYPHERSYIYKFGPLSFGLFLGGAIFAFKVVLPFALDFFIGFNQRLGFEPTIRISEWISFAVFLPVMFGIAFQMPLVMLFLERIGVFEVGDYREKRGVAIFVISIVSAVLTPQDPITLVLMMIPLVVLYELGIWMCLAGPKKDPFATA